MKHLPLYGMLVLLLASLVLSHHDHHHGHDHTHDHSHGDDHQHHHEHDHDEDTAPVIESINAQGEVEEEDIGIATASVGERVDDDDDDDDEKEKDNHHHKKLFKHLKKHHGGKKKGSGEGCPFMKDNLAQLKSFRSCPKFKEGCPYKTEELLAKLKECPAFKDNCPFAVDKENKIDLDKLHECPVFRDGSCPFMVDAHGHPNLASVCPFLEKSSRKNKAISLVRLYYLMEHNNDVEHLLADDFTFVSGNAVASQYRNTPLSKDTFLKVASTLSKLFPDKKLDIIETVAEDNTVVVHTHLKGTYTVASTFDSPEYNEVFKGQEGTTKSVDYTAVMIVHFNDDTEKIVSAKSFYDVQSFCQQLGIPISI